jgi:hypothetical protein
MSNSDNHSFVNASFPAAAENTSVQWAQHVNSHVISVLHEHRTVMSIYLTDDDARALHEALGASLESHPARQAKSEQVQS